MNILTKSPTDLLMEKVKRETEIRVKRETEKRVKLETEIRVKRETEKRVKRETEKKAKQEAYQEKVSVVLNMINQNCDDAFIQTIVQIPEVDIAKIREENSK